MKRNRLVLVCLSALVVGRGSLYAQDKKDKDKSAQAEASAPVPKLTDVETEEFLRTAKIIKTKAAKKGITGTTRDTLTNGTITHDAHVQCVDEAKSEYKTDHETILNFKDSYKFNIAAYKLDRLLGIGNVPITVERKVRGKTCAVDWWVDNVMMDEADRHQKKMTAPDPDSWNDQMYVVRVFDQLIANFDSNLTNLLILNNWDIVMVDHSRSFQLNHKIAAPKNLVMCDRTLLKNMRALEKDAVLKALMPYCTKPECEAVMARRDLIVKFFDDLVKEKGESGVLYDLKKPARASSAINQ
jgi:hypothetical protein